MGKDSEPGVYKAVYHLIKSMDEEGGRMWWRSGGSGGGGVWVLEMEGRATEVPVHGRDKNALDELYVPKVDNPKTWDDYDHPGTLKDDAPRRLLALFAR